ncbi:MAG: NAD(P)/FAD-dependent oxidoreductase [Gammaproteobacteria bacterium]|nr:NAD(P)/FAD-dependent oxidoreductase [Gammaproteobacteria bacterium]
MPNKVIIVGSGFSGICMGIKLKQAGIEDFIILEKSTDLGGTWRENSYPGAECDIPSALYSYSFAPNPNWEHVWSKREQIFQYQRDVATQYGITQHFRFGQRVSSAKYENAVWTIKTQDSTYEATHFISAVGQLHERFTPEIIGAETFEGEQFHAAKWNHDAELQGKSVAVIGSAASAVQLIPQVAKQASKLTVLQRTPNWMIEKPNRRYSTLEHWVAKHIPILRKAYRNLLYLQADGILYRALIGKPISSWFVKKLVNRNLKKHIRDDDLRARLTPSYTVGAKRILFSDTFYKTLNKDHVELETQAIEAIEARGIRTSSGRVIPADVIIYATGFITNPFLKSIEVEGTNGSLKQAWSKGAHAYLGINTSGFPNLHMMYGPNTNLGHNSIIIMIEAQASYIARNIKLLEEDRGKVLDVPEDIEREYNIAIQKRLKDMVFSKIEHSWYMDQGRITNNWAGSTWEYKKRLKNQELQSLLTNI